MTNSIRETRQGQLWFIYLKKILWHFLRYSISNVFFLYFLNWFLGQAELGFLPYFGKEIITTQKCFIKQKLSFDRKQSFTVANEMEVILLEWKSWWVFYPTQKSFFSIWKILTNFDYCWHWTRSFVQMSQVFTKNIPLIYNCKNDNLKCIEIKKTVNWRWEFFQSLQKE